MLEGSRNAKIANQLLRKLFPPKLPHLMPAGDAPVWGGHWWWTAFRQAQNGESEEQPCPHCQYFGGEEHHPCCPRTMHYTAHPDGTATGAGFACEVCGVPAGVPCDGGLHG